MAEQRTPIEDDDDDGIGENGYLFWHPRSHTAHTEPTLRFLVEKMDGTCVIKYLTLPQNTWSGLDYTPAFFESREYNGLEPIYLEPGDWNHANIAFTRDDYGDLVVDVSHSKLLEFSQINSKAIWNEKPKIEYVELEPDLDDKNPVRPNDKRARIQIVTHHSFDDLMFMKIVPTPMMPMFELEKEMQAYRACDGKGITPQFLANVTENGRVVGFLAEYIEGAHKPSTEQEKELCRNALRRFHKLTGWHRCYTANHRDNYLIKDGKAIIIDLARAKSPSELSTQETGWVDKVHGQWFDSWWNKTRRP